MSAQDRLNAKVQYFTLKLLVLIARRLLFKDISSEQDRKDLFDWQDAYEFLKEEFNG